KRQERRPVMTCINLLTLFGDGYRITFDEAYNPRNVPRVKLDPWMMQIPCQGRGVTIYPHGGTTLAVEVDRRPSIAAKLAALEGLKLHQDGDTEMTLLFDVGLFEKVAEIVRPKRRKMLTDLQRQTLTKHAFQCRDGAQESTLKRAPTPQADILVT